jgi:hypothetical protein
VRVQVTWALVTKRYLTKLGPLRDAFFHAATPEAELRRLQGRFAEQATPLTLLDLSRLRVRYDGSSLLSAHSAGQDTWRDAHGIGQSGAQHARFVASIEPSLTFRHAAPVYYLLACRGTSCRCQCCQQRAGRLC